MHKLNLLLVILILAGARPAAAVEPVLPDALPYHSLCPRAGFEKRLVIHQLYVGQGDAAIIRTPSGVMLLIDGGESVNYAKVILPTLKKCYKATKFDYVVLTHPHSDHFGGIGAMVKDIVKNGDRAPVKFDEMLIPTKTLEKGDMGAQFLAMVDGAEKLGRVIVDPELGSRTIVDKGRDVDFDIVVSNGKITGKGLIAGVYKESGFLDDTNSVSIGMMISFGDFKFFTAGDLTGGKTGAGAGHPDLETPLAKVVSPVDVYKSSHHASDTSNKPVILQALAPKNIIVSVGAGGKNAVSYKLPRKEAMESMNAEKSVKNIFLSSIGVPTEYKAKDTVKLYKKVKNLGIKDAKGIVETDETGKTYQIIGYKYVSRVFEATANSETTTRR